MVKPPAPPDSERTLRRALRAASRGNFDVDTIDHMRALAFCERESERELAATQSKGDPDE